MDILGAEGDELSVPKRTIPFGQLDA
jgi:hypothetical protein